MAVRLLNKLYLYNNRTIVRQLHFTKVLDKVTKFILSDIGEGIKEVTLRDWFVKVGDHVQQFDNICLVESDKASVNITSRYDGVIKNLYYNIGDTALVGYPLVDIETIGVDVKESKTAAATVASASDAVAPALTKQYGLQDINLPSIDKKLTTPAVRRVAMEHNINLKDIAGSGKKGRIMKEDVLNFVNLKKQPTLSTTNTALHAVNDDKIVPITGIKKVMVKTMTASNNIPTFNYYDKVNVTKLTDIRKDVQNSSKKLKVTYLPFIVKALSKCLLHYPEINSIVDEKCENYTIRHCHNIGIAMDTPNGLIVPNIKNVQNLSFLQTVNELNSLTEKGKKGQLMPNDMLNGTISISNIGVIGGTYASPLINPPEVCILAVGQFRTVPIFDEGNDKIIKAQVCSLSWAADHRIIDGATIARFANLFKEYIENPFSVMFE